MGKVLVTVPGGTSLVWDLDRPRAKVRDLLVGDPDWVCGRRVTIKILSYGKPVRIDGVTASIRPTEGCGYRN